MTVEGRAASRSRWVEALCGLLVFADELKTRTDTVLARGGLDLLHRVTYFICFRGRRTLQACQVLVPREWDDIVGNLTRSLIEAAIDLDYLHVSTTRRSRRDGPETTLTPVDKARLYEGQVVLFEKKRSGRLRPDHVDWYNAVVALRAEHGLENVFWHGRRISGEGDSILQELLGAAAGDEARTGRLNAMAEWFAIASYFEHDNPNMNFYISPEGEGHRILETMAHPAIIETVVRAGGEICWSWGAVLGLTSEALNAGLRPVLVAHQVEAALGQANRDENGSTGTADEAP